MFKLRKVQYKNILDINETVIKAKKVTAFIGESCGGLEVGVQMS